MKCDHLKTAGKFHSAVETHTVVRVFYQFRWFEDLEHNICLNKAGPMGKQAGCTYLSRSLWNFFFFYRSAFLQETTSHVFWLPPKDENSPTKNPEPDILFVCKCGLCRYYHLYTHALHSGWLHWPKQTWQQLLCCGAYRIYSPLSKGKTCRHSNCWMKHTHFSMHICTVHAHSWSFSSQ